MAAYDFSTLNSSDLEDLVCDLLNEDQPQDSVIKYKTFKEGRDLGIDILYSSDSKEYDHVGQVKHYRVTGYTGLIKDLKEKEVDKVKKLSPNRYIFATSVDLLVSNTKEIKEVFTPYIKNINDIYGKKNLNRLIEKHENVLHIHYKLWLSDISVLKIILNSDLEFRSTNFIENELKKRIRLYVQTPMFRKAQNALVNNNFIIITGEPGVGKTTLAEMLIYEYIAKGYRLTYVLDDIRDAEKVLTMDDSKQIIYYDDFLGSNAVEIEKSKGNETRLRKILRRITKMTNKLVVFTTRTHLLESALEDSENLRRFNLKAQTSTFELKEYDLSLKKKLFINHIEESSISSEFKDLLYEERIVNFVINHNSFTPRSVEYITSENNIEVVNVADYEIFVKNSFEYPEEIWKHAYLNQINEDDRLLLNTLLTFGKPVNIELLENSFLQRERYEVEFNNKSKKIYSFKKTLKRLDGGFIIIKKDKIDFINPSLVDFLLDFLKKDFNEVLSIIESIRYAPQFSERLHSLALFDEKGMSKYLQRRLIEDYNLFINDKGTRDAQLIQMAILIHKYVICENTDVIICDIIEEIEEWESLHYNYILNSQFRLFMKSVKKNIKINSLLQEKIIEITTELVTGEYDITDAIKLFNSLTSSFEIDFNTIDTQEINYHFDELFEDYISQEAQWLVDYALDEKEVEDKLLEIKFLSDKFNDFGFKYVPNFGPFERSNWNEIILYNLYKRAMEKDD
ncbi:AAA family ATPase [Thalassobellus suaedae]|uniref:AAA+ ATPase domain-containing protein n=1 Tax=Thalassobellus suaedae TaxID=3074124 RepID=A0ABY9Y2U1_9FLAO|nr:hypothetical protein RHP49_16900 [Flavobacteriaceae bacterium HL-DH10]